MGAPAMRARHLEFSGPTLQPIGKWIVGFAILAICAFLFGLGVSRGLPGWFQNLGLASILLFLLGGSICVVILYFKHRGKWVGQVGILPKIWANWVLDRPESVKKSRHDRRGN
jgi:phosphatidylglycerophosphate synthase